MRRDIRVARTAVLVDRDVAIALAREVEVELAVGRERRMEGDAEQAALAARRESVVDVDEGRREQDAGLDDANLATLFDDEQAVRTVRRVGHLHGRAETRTRPG